MSNIFYDRQKKNSTTPIIVFLCILFLLLGVGAFLLAFSQAVTAVDDNISSDGKNSEQTIEPTENHPDDVVPAAAMDGETGSEETISNISEPEKYDYTAEVPMSQAVPISYLDDAAFIGDSITEGMKIHNQSNAFIASATSMSASSLMSKPMDTYNGQTLVEALNGAQPKKIYVMIGSNEVGGTSMEGYISKYSELIDTLKKANPDAIIYMQSITPTTKAYHDADNILNNDNINSANSQLKLLAFEKKVFYVDVNSALIDETGFLPDDASPMDGVHFGTTYFNMWIDYLLTHSIDYDTYIAQRDTFYAP